MVVFESFVAATITSFLAPLVSRPLSRNKSSKIRAPLTDAKKTVIAALDILVSVQETLDQKLHHTLFDDCQRMGVHIADLLKASNEDMNILTKSRKYREMVKEAREEGKEGRLIEYHIESLLKRTDQRENNVEARAEEEAIAYMERKIRYNTAKREYQKLCGPGRQQ
ncbi:hypothetical protein C0993_005278 [Termitomyces sp. T159_Od127]|nr:hypothetical protein C0993_005278 [Termitomyces sp. T159_Od127]